MLGRVYRLTGDRCALGDGGSRRRGEDNGLQGGLPTTLTPKVGILGLTQPKKRGVGKAGPPVNRSRRLSEDNRPAGEWVQGAGPGGASLFISHTLLKRPHSGKIVIQGKYAESKSITPKIWNPLPPEEDRPRRGKIKGCSGKAMTRFCNKMAQVDPKAEGFTCMLTMPGEEFLTDDHVTDFQNALRRIQRWMNYHWREVGGFYKIEAQSREHNYQKVAHAHLLLFTGSISEEEKIAIHQGIMIEWHRLVGAGQEAHLRLHLRSNNWIKVEEGFDSYIGKYMTKEEAAEYEGKTFWGKFNADHIPFGERQEMHVHPKVIVQVQRWRRKQKEKMIKQAVWDNVQRRRGGMWDRYDALLWDYDRVRFNLNHHGPEEVNPEKRKFLQDQVKRDYKRYNLRWGMPKLRSGSVISRRAESIGDLKRMLAQAAVNAELPDWEIGEEESRPPPPGGVNRFELGKMSIVPIPT